MITREEVAAYTPPRSLLLPGPPNWTAVVFFAALSALHLVIAVPAFYRGRWEALLSFVFAFGFAVVGLACFYARREMSILPRDRQVCLSSGVGPLRFRRFVDFSDIRAVRLTLNHGKRADQSRIELLCDNEDLDCPPSSIPRQQALFLAILMNVQLIKVTNDSDDAPPAANRLAGE